MTTEINLTAKISPQGIIHVAPRVESWKEHLSHHKETEYCLDYYT